MRRQAEILLGENALNGCWNLLARCFPAELFIRLKLTLPRQLKHEAAKYVPTSQPSRYLPLTYSAPRTPRAAPTYREHRASRPDRARELDTSVLSEADRKEFEEARLREEELKEQLRRAKADSALRNARIRELGEIARQEAALEERKRRLNANHPSTPAPKRTSVVHHSTIIECRPVSEPPPKAKSPTPKPARKTQTAAVTSKPKKDKAKSAGAIATSASKSRGKTPITPEFVESSGTSESDHPAEEDQPSLDARIEAQILADERMEEDLLFD